MIRIPFALERDERKVSYVWFKFEKELFLNPIISLASFF